MLSYLHAFHAGNFADVHKHAALTLAVRMMQAKSSAIACFDTHAGSASYDLAGDRALKTGEAAAGIRSHVREPVRPQPAHPHGEHSRQPRGVPSAGGGEVDSHQVVPHRPLPEVLLGRPPGEPGGFEPRSALQHLATTSKRRRCHNGIPRAGERVVGPQQKAPQARAPAAGPAGQAGAGPQ